MGNLKRWATAGVALVGSIALPVYADVPEAVTTALTAAKTDATTVAGAVIAIIVAIAAFRYMRRAIS